MFVGVFFSCIDTRAEEERRGHIFVAGQLAHLP